MEGTKRLDSVLWIPDSYSVELGLGSVLLEPNSGIPDSISSGMLISLRVAMSNLLPRLADLVSSKNIFSSTGTKR